jgi:hypothetical protein
MLELGEVRAHRRYAGRARGKLADRSPGGSPVHGILAEEAAEIVALFDEWGEVDRSHSKLAHCGSYRDRVWESPSTVRRLLSEADKHFRPLPRPGRSARPFPEWAEYSPNSIWSYDTVRHKTPWNRVEVSETCTAALSQPGGEAVGSLIPKTRGGWEAALTTTGRASTTGWRGPGKRDGKVDARNQWCYASQETPPALIRWMWAGWRCATHPSGRGTPGPVNVAGREVTVKVCGVTVTRPQGHSWPSHLSIGFW